MQSQEGEKKLLKCVKVVKILNKMGLHIRPATKIVKLLRKFKSSVVFSTSKKTINARNLMDIVSLAVKKGNDIIITTEGIDAEETLKSLSEAFKNEFH